VVMAAVAPSIAQQERRLVREGNDLFGAGKFEEAEVQYRKALEREEASRVAAFNLADALYKQKKHDDALQQFTNLAANEKDKQRLGEIFHNIGNTLLEQNKLDECIEAYKQSLRARPASPETKYNLEYARQKKQEQENQDKQQDQDKDQNKDQDKQQDQNKDQNKDQDKQQDQNKDQKQDQDKQQDQKQDQKQDQEQQPGAKISPEDAKRLLNALEAAEKETRERVQEEKAKVLQAKRAKIEKNW
jgi:tetratricopeptide (TPR) repeat protein